MNPRRFLAVLALFLVPTAARAAEPPKAIDFNRDVRPILSENCLACHGPDEKKRKGDLRLDVRADAVAAGAITPGKPAASKLVERITSKEFDELMPPVGSGKKLTAAQIETLRKWVAEGAEYKTHWAFIPPVRPAIPASRDREGAAWVRNPIDNFVLAKLREHGLSPSPEADKTTLIRRVTLDLTGLPPTLKEVDAFLADNAPDAYEKVVDRLLASPRYGERMTVDWLDAARFADTHGYHIDSGRNMIPFRDYVIKAFNDNKPFDVFTVEQLAGDLLPNATLEQKIASGFNRNHMINFEGGAIPEEYQTAYIVDRINTTATVWMGVTLGCAQCHDHKYDPFTQTDFYRLYAFFNNVPENGLDGQKGNAVPVLKVPTKEQEQKRRELAEQVARVDAAAKQAARNDPATRAAIGGPAAAAVLLRADRERKTAQDALAAFEKTIPDTMVMSDMPKPRDTFILMRGQYDKKGEKVTVGTPASLSPMPKGAPANRLGFAQWLISPEHPLTARVMVNRDWQRYFGTGIVKTAEDFGSQGEWPTHPELLDWLASEFMNPAWRAGERKFPGGTANASGGLTSPGSPGNWNVKHIQRLIVTSATYRQSSRVTPELLAKDPENRLLARQSRLRLQAEFLRDQSLAVSGLLNGEIGGKSVFPYQPRGLWEELAFRQDNANFSAQVYTPGKGADLYRRTMYTFWKRTSPPPALVTLDAPDREICTVRRPRTNTPLQALVLMNDPIYVESARKLAERIMTDGGATTADRLTFAFRLCTARKPTERELTILTRLFDAQLARFRANTDAAVKLLSVGESPRNEKLDAAELAAWAMVASTILNLDETVTRN